MTDRIFIHFWPLIVAVSAVLYVLTLLFLPFSSLWATIMLFTLISYWSRLPGTGIKTPFFALYFIDVVDFFSLIIAINIGGVPAAIFVAFCNLISRAGGCTPPWNSVIRATINQFVICLIIPFLHYHTGENIIISMLIYTILFRIGFIIQYVLTPWQSPAQFAVLWTGITIVMAAINGTYAYFFGEFFDSILQQGIKFNWMLFAATTAVMIIGKIMLYGSKRENKIINAVKRIFIQRKAKKEEEEEDDDIIEVKENRNVAINDLHIPDPHEIVLPYFKCGNKSVMIAGSMKKFKKRMMIIFVVLFSLKLFAVSMFPGIIRMVISLAIMWLLIEFLIRTVKKINNASKMSIGRLSLRIGMLSIFVIVYGMLLV